MKIDPIALLQRMKIWRLWLLSVILSVLLAEAVVAIMGLLLKGEVTPDYLLTGLVASWLVASLVVALVVYFLKNVAGNQQLLQAIFDTTAEGIMVADGAGRITAFNQRFAEMWRISPDILASGDSDAALKLVVDQLAEPEQFLTQVRQLHANPEATCFDTLTFKDGRVFERYLSPQRIKGKTTGRIWRLRDITERKQAEEALRESEVRMRAILDNAPYLTWLKDTKGRYLKVNKSYADYARRNNAQQIIGKTDFDLWPQELAEKHHADDTEVMSTRQQKHVEEPSFDGDKLHWMETFKTPILDEHGKVLGTVGFARDISARKRNELELRIAATAFESQEGMMVTDVNNVILRVNHAFTDITGYTAEDAVGRTPRLLSSGRHDAAFYAAIWECIRNTGSWQGEIWNRRKNGELYPEWLTITAVKGYDGTTTHYVATLIDITQRKAAEDEIRYLAFYDLLTLLPNRRLLLDRLQQAVASASRNKREGALLFIDMDNFKTLNDTLGHDQGDLLLQQVAQRLTTCVRECDTVARLGGDEFVVMLEDLSEHPREASAQAEIAGEKILAILNRPYQLAEHEYHSTPSIGITLFGSQQQSVDELLKQADIAMYQAKASGRNAVRFFDPDMQSAVSARAALEADLRQGIQEAQLLLHYQPQMDSNNRMTGAEALVRWQHPERGLVTPNEFIPLAEETGLILPIGQWVLETACTQLAAWKNQTEMAHLTLAVNVSSRQFRHPDFVAQVLAVLKRSGANPGKLKLELTESLLVDDVDDTIIKMTALKAHGVNFSLDDFGTGYSSLTYLKTLPLFQLKIDRSFVRDVLNDPNDAAIARTIIALAQSLGLSVIAEGVETNAQRDMLARKGCHTYQGYLFSRPLPVDQVEAFMLENC